MALINDRFKPGLITTTVDFLFNWARTSSLWPLILGTACCAIETMAVGISRYDFLERYGMLYRFSPRQSDVMLVSGTVTYKMANVLRTIYDQMAEPRWVIAMGNCATSGGPFPTYATVQGIDEIVPVDIYVPGCPPTPEAQSFGILKLMEKIKRDTIAKTTVDVEGRKVAA